MYFYIDMKFLYICMYIFNTYIIYIYIYIYRQIQIQIYIYNTSHSSHLSTATSKNPSVVNAIYNTDKQIDIQIDRRIYQETTLTLRQKLSITSSQASVAISSRDCLKFKSKICRNFPYKINKILDTSEVFRILRLVILTEDPSFVFVFWINN